MDVRHVYMLVVLPSLVKSMDRQRGYSHDLRNEVEAEFFVNVLGKVAHPGRLLS